jgi:hypothetical protein
VPALAESLGYVCTTDTRLRCAARVNPNQHTTSVFSFVRDEVQELRPSGIINRFSKHSTSQAFDVQIFHSDQTVIVDEPARKFVVKVRALISNVRVNPLEQLHSLTSALRAFLSSRNLSLCAPELCLCLSIPARIFNFRPVVKGSERGESNVNADPRGAFRQRLGFTLDAETGVPLASLALDVKFFNLTFERAMKFDLNEPDLGDMEFRALKRISDPSERERVVSSGTSKSWIARLLFAPHPAKERLEGFIHALQNIFDRVRVHVGEFGANLFDFGKLFGLRKEVDRSPIELPRITTLLQSCIKQLAAQRECAVKLFSLPLRRVKPVAEYSVQW